jgi:hypothetical protein
MLQQTCVVLCNSRGPGETVLYVPVKPVAWLQLQLPGTTTVPLTSLKLLRHGIPQIIALLHNEHSMARVRKQTRPTERPRWS